MAASVCATTFNINRQKIEKKKKKRINIFFLIILIDFFLKIMDLL